MADGSIPPLVTVASTVTLAVGHAAVLAVQPANSMRPTMSSARYRGVRAIGFAPSIWFGRPTRAEEAHQLPALAFQQGSAKGRHLCPGHAGRDGPRQLTVEPMRNDCAQVRWAPGEAGGCGSVTCSLRPVAA